MPPPSTMTSGANAAVIFLRTRPRYEIFNDAAFIRYVPNLSTGRHSCAFSHHPATDGEGRTDTCTQRDADRARNSECGSDTHFAEEESGGIIEEADLIRLPPKALCQGLGQVDAVEIREFVVHPTYAFYIVEWTGHCQLGAEGVVFGGGLFSEGVEDIEKGVAGMVLRQACPRYRAEMIIVGKAKCGRDMASTNVVYQDTGTYCGRHAHLSF